jgi:hypothetical protein
MSYRLMGKNLGAAQHLGRYFHPLRRAVYGLEYVDPALLCQNIDEIDVDESMYTPWPDWLAQLMVLRPGVCDAEGWGACYGAGMSPEQAIACCDHGIERAMVERYWTCPGAAPFKLLFD